MSKFFHDVTPSATSMIRLDHTHVLAAFHRFKPDLSPARKQALVHHACLGLEVHAQLEEEIFYPALRRVLPDNQILSKSEPEHDAMKQLIQVLREQNATDANFDDRFYELMRIVLHHVADEETILLPAAEAQMSDQLRQLGAMMTKRRTELLGPRSGEAALTGALTFPYAATAMLSTAVLVGGLVWAAASGRRPQARWR
jgi:hemerythrin superfamily protein